MNIHMFIDLDKINKMLKIILKEEHKLSDFSKYQTFQIRSTGNETQKFVLYKAL